jgi:hypothetical protein
MSTRGRALTARRSVNERLWDVEDDLREKERGQGFGGDFVERARSVYRLNDERARLKRRANELCGSALVEEKFYAPYGPRLVLVEGPGATPPDGPSPA